MLSSNKDRAYRHTSTLTLATLFSVVGLGELAAQTQSPLARSFNELFANQGTVTPLFARPEVSSRLPALTTLPDESAPELAATASANQPGSSEPQGQ
jgi:hypothetical protein